MALPTTTQSTAGTTTKPTIYAATDKGYTGFLTGYSAPKEYLYSSNINYANQLGGLAGSSLNGGGSGSGGGGGLRLPSLNLTGLDKALGVLGAAAALMQLPQAIGNAVTGLAQTAAGIAKAGFDLVESIRNIRFSLPDFSNIFDGATTAFSTIASPANPNDWRVRLNTNFALLGNGATPDILEPLKKTNGMIFPFTPSVMVTHKANYNTTEPMHNNFAVQSYKNSNVEDITITGDFAVQNDDDAKYFVAVVAFLRGATKMFYGKSTPAGNPPIVCTLSGYGTYFFNNVPVVIKSFSTEMPKDANYKKIVVGGTPHWVPMTNSITVIVSPVYNRAQLREFSIADYVSGTAQGIL
jgi:hypothetical protein